LLQGLKPYFNIFYICEYILHSNKTSDVPFSILQSKIAQTCRGLLKWAKLWASVKELSRAYEYVMGLIIFMPTAVLSWFPFVLEFQTRLLFNQAFSRGLQISMILAGKKDTYKAD
jgi:callose synthase